MVRNAVFFLACLAACGGGGPTPDESGNNPGTNPDNQPAVQYGTLHTVVTPAIDGAAPVQLRLDGTMMPNLEIQPGSEREVELEAGTHTVGLVCPDYCWATENGTWASNSTSCSEWELDLEVPANDTARLEATLCRDLTGWWMTPDGESDVWIQSSNGTCRSFGFASFNFDEIRGDQVRAGSVWAPILENGWRIEIDGITFVRLE